MPSFRIQTLGCKVNQYESEQLAGLLRSHGLRQSETEEADVCIVNTCSVTLEAAAKSRQAVRRAGKRAGGRRRVLVTGCWATSDKSAAGNIPGVDAVLGHHDEQSGQISRLLAQWSDQQASPSQPSGTASPFETQPKFAAPITTPPGSLRNDESMDIGGLPAGQIIKYNKPQPAEMVKQIPGPFSLPLLDAHQTGRQRAVLKIQDGCDAHCTYCIIPRLRPNLWSKNLADAVEEARRLVASGHRELVLTGIFLGAYGQPTALRHRQSANPAGLAELVDALCENVPGLLRLRLSSLEPGDVTPRLLDRLKIHRQVVPHFHLPLQSGSDLLLHRMNRQYRRDDFLRLIDRIQSAFDRPALTTDIIVGFPGETDAEFEKTLQVVDQVRFMHIHAFPFSPRPGTAAARWTKQFRPAAEVRKRINLLSDRSDRFNLEYQRQFLGQSVELLVERDPHPDPAIRHGRCERYFDVHFEAADVGVGDLVRVRVDRITPHRTVGTFLGRGGGA